MSLVRKSTIVALVAIVVVSTAPSAAAGIDEPDDWSDHEVFDESEASDSYSTHGNNKSLKKAYINVTSSTVQFRANINATGVDGLDDNALQIYIDTDLDAQTGLNSETVSDNQWGDFYDGVGDIGADYRVTASDGGVPIVEEHDDDAIFDTLGEVDIVESGDKVVLEVDKETIGNPDDFDVKFAYISNPGTADPSESEFGWAPENAVRVGSEGGEAAKTATVEPTVTFGEALDDEASVEFTLTNDDGTQTVKQVNHSSSSDLTETFTVDPNNFDGGDSSEITVEVIDDDEYSFEREVDNTKSIGSLSGGGTEAPTIDLATINATVKFGTEAVDEDGSVIFTLTENDDGDTTDREIDYSSSADLEESFTVNPNNFGSSGILKVEVVDDETYPYSETKDVDSVAQNNSINKLFEADTIGQDFTLINEQTDPYDIATNPDEFTLDVKLESEASPTGSDIYVVRHVIDFDPARIDEENISVNYDAGPTDFKTDDYLTTGVGTDVEGDGTYEIEIVAAGDYNTDSDAIREVGKNETLYDVTFPLEDIQGEIDQGPENAIDVTPNTADETELFDSNNNSVSYTSSAQTVNVSNSNTAIEDEGIEYTHLTEGGNMVGAPMKFDVGVTTNDGKLDEIRLENTGGAVLEEDGSDVKINCNSKSSCDGILEYTPVQSNNTAVSGNYEREEFHIVIEDADNEETTIPDDTEDIDNVWAKIYKANDVNRDTKPADVDDVRAVISNRTRGNGELPWDENEVARADLDNDGEVGITEVTTIANEYSP
jgi:hypothetical protein